MRSKQRHPTAETVVNSEQLATLKQLEKILQIRANRKQKLESRTRELRRILEQKKILLREETERAQAFDRDTRQAIRQLSTTNLNKPLRINEVLNWSQQEVTLKRDIERCYQACDQVQEQIDSARFKLDSHLKVYRQAVMDYEKIVIIKQELDQQVDYSS
jgi:hypothetical protein